MEIEGVFPPVTTPFDENGCIVHDHLTENIKRWNETDVSGYLILGSNSETVFLNDEEKLEIIKTSRRSIPSSKRMLVGTGLECTKGTIEFTRRAADCGADVAVIITPHFFKSNMFHEAFMKHYLMVADNSPIPVLTPYIISLEEIFRSSICLHFMILSTAIGSRDTLTLFRATSTTFSMVNSAPDIIIDMINNF